MWHHYSLDPAERFIDSPRVRLRVQEFGSGEPVVFVGGTGGTGPYWGPLVAELKDFRCLMIDRPRWGLSSPLDYAQHEYKTVAADLLRETIDALGPERTYMVGASVGDVWRSGWSHGTRRRPAGSSCSGRAGGGRRRPGQ